jgi:release factor glutamine methyltransferase
MAQECSGNSPLAELLPGEQILSWRQQQLAKGGQPNDLDWLLDLGGGLRWGELQLLHLDPGRQVELSRSLDGLASLWHRHLTTAEPLQYLVGLCPWRDLQLDVAPGVLIPRQETELLVECALGLMGGRGPGLWADLGTGSGCLALALARAWPASRGFAVDQSPAAIAIATRNLQAPREGPMAPVELLLGSWWQPLESVWGQLELVVCNPPYIPTEVWAALDPVVRDHEPARALDGGRDGLDAIRTIGQGAAKALAPGGWLLLEHHHDQSLAVQGLLVDAGLEQVRSYPDLEGIQRFVAARRPPVAGLERGQP